MLGDAFEVRKAASSVGFAGERPVPRRPHAGPSSGRSPANPTLLAAFLTSKASPRILARLRSQCRSQRSDRAINRSSDRRADRKVRSQLSDADVM